MTVVTAGDGTRLHVVQDGAPSDVPLVLANSIGATHAMWDGVLPALAARFRVVRFDMRGHGRSDAPAGDYALSRLAEDVVDILDALDIHEAYLCGLSLGGLVAQAVAIHYPDRVDRLILANTTTKFATPQAWTERMGRVASGGMASIVDLAMERFFSPSTLAAADPRALAIRQAFLELDPGGYTGCCAALRDSDLTESIAQISAPALVIGGAGDVSTPPDATAALARALGAPHSVLDAAHLSAVEDPQGFAALVIAHLA